MLNSEALRASYNACLPLLSAYQTDLAQSEPLYRAYEGISKREGDALGPVEKRVVEHALRDFRLAGVGLDTERKRRFKTVMLELTQLQAKFEENVLDATNGWTHHVTNGDHLRGLNETIVEQARKRAHEKHMEGWLLTLDQPTYVAVVTDAEYEPLRNTVYEAWTTRASDRGPNAGKWDNSQVMENILQLRHEAARLLDFKNYAEYALATRMARSGGRSHHLPARAREVGAMPRRARSSKSSKRSPGASSTRGTSASTPNACSASATRSRRKSCGRTSRCRTC